MTPRVLIRNTIAVFRQAGIPDPETDAAFLLSHLTGRPILDLRLDSETELPDEIISQYEQLSKERTLRIPLQHLTGYQYFHGHEYHVNKHVLIPRPETAELVEHLTVIFRFLPAPSILDLCCGSGCIGIELALSLPDSTVTAVDISEEALHVASDNASRLGASVRFVHSDLFSSVKGEVFDLIVSNPPYIPSDECDHLQPEVMSEPRLALDGGADGLRFYSAIIPSAYDHLKDGGMIAFEIGIGEERDIVRMLQNHSFHNTRIIDDIAGIPRMIFATK